jgi:FMN phosphatase YigB (HAD superfamily)
VTRPNHKQKPAALLLDFGGVIFETRSRPGWTAQLAKEVHAQLAAAGHSALDGEMIETDLLAALAANKAWKAAMSRPYAPRDTTHAQFWGDFVAADWPEPARTVVLAHATPLCRRMGELCADRTPREGIRELFDSARRRDIPIGVVSNALLGDVHRLALAETGLEQYIAVQLYSDELGIRKPNPEMIATAARALDVSAQQCWYVGDNYDRDVVCGRRAQVACNVLMVAKSTYKRPYRVRDEPDVVVADPHELLSLLEDSQPQ